MSRTPIREALIQLASTGFVEMRPRRGAVIPELAPQRLVEMFELMAELEAMCGRLAARRMSEADHHRLVQAHEACQALSNEHDPDGYYHENQVFHHVIYEASHNSFLAEQASALAPTARPVPPAATARAGSHGDLHCRAHAHRRRDPGGEQRDGRRAVARARPGRRGEVRGFDGIARPAQRAAGGTRPAKTRLARRRDE